MTDRSAKTVPPAAPARKPIPPRPEPRREPLSAPNHEETKHGVAPPSEGSYAPDSRELVLPEWEPPTNARRAKAEAHRHGDRLVRAPQSVVPPSSKPGSKNESIPPEVLESVKALRKGAGVIGKWLAGVLVAALLGGGGAVVGSKTATQLPPGLAECPAEVEQLRSELARLRDRTDRLERRDDEALDRWRRTDTKAEDALGKASELEKRLPKINP